MRRPRILIVQADPATLADLSGCVESLGFEVRTALDGAGAIAAARRLQPDLALIDVDLPGGVDGVSAGDQVHGELEIPVVFLAAPSDARVAARTSGSSAFAYVGKPFSAREVQTIVELALYRHGMERMLALSEQRFRLLFEQNPAGVVVEAADGRILECNRALAQMLGYASPDDLRDAPAANLFLDPLEELERRQRVAAGEILSNEETRLRHRDGRAVWAVDNALLVPDPVTGRGHILRTVLDITERKEMEKVLEQLAYHDALTGLPNRRLLQIRAEQTLAEARRRGERAALVFLDLVGFKEVNDRLGHEAGDELLVQVARRLKEGLRRTDAAARFGGDEFVVLLSGVDDRAGAEQAAERILGRLSEPFTLSAGELRARARAGVALYPDQATGMKGLIGLADGALTRAKAKGRPVVVFAKDPSPPPSSPPSSPSSLPPPPPPPL